MSRPDRKQKHGEALYDNRIIIFKSEPKSLSTCPTGARTSKKHINIYVRSSVRESPCLVHKDAVIPPPLNRSYWAQDVMERIAKNAAAKKYSSVLPALIRASFTIDRSIILSPTIINGIDRKAGAILQCCLHGQGLSGGDELV